MYTTPSTLSSLLTRLFKIAQTHIMASKQQIIDERQSNLPLPEQPPRASDWNSADERTVNVGSGGRSEDLSHSGLGGDTLREPATTDDVGNTGRQAKDGL